MRGHRQQSRECPNCRNRTYWRRRNQPRNRRRHRHLHAFPAVCATCRAACSYRMRRDTRPAGRDEASAWSCGRRATQDRPRNRRTRHATSIRPSSLRSKISRSGTPASASMTAGLYPPLTSTTASCTPSRNGARYALRGAKKNHSTPAVTSSAIISAIAMCIFQPPSVRNWLSISANTITIYPYRVYWQEGRANFSRR